MILSTPARVARHRSARTVSLMLSLMMGLGGCAGYQAFREGQANLAEGRAGAGIAKLQEAMRASPENLEYRRAYFVQRDAAVNAALRHAEQALERGDFARANEAYASALALDPANTRAVSGAARVDGAQRHWGALDAALGMARERNLDAAVAKVQQVLSENPAHRRAALVLRQLTRQQADASGKELGLYPKLKAAYRVPVSLTFTNATLLQVFEALKQASGLNYMIERDVRPDLRITLSVTNKPVEDIVRLLLATNQLERRVLDDDTLLIYPNTPAKATEYREMIVRTFYLSTAEASKVANAVKTIVRARDVTVDEKLNMLVVRDSAEVIRLAEKLIAAHDLAEPEVMLELEVLEIGVNRLLELGIRWPDSVAAGVVGADGVLGQLRLDELRNRHSGMVQLTTSSPVISAQLRGTKGDSHLLANPRVRVRNRHAAKIMIGERVPVITTQATANVGTTESVSYLDVGLKLDIEPSISLDDEVSMKLSLEVSNILEVIARSNGSRTYRLGTRSTSTALRVRDGETNILAGLIQRDERNSNTGIPGLNEIPVASRLFGASQDSDTRTEIVLLITPRIVRNLDVPGVGLQEFMAGTEAAMGAGPIQLGAPQVPGQPPLRPGTPGFGAPDGGLKPASGMAPSVFPSASVIPSNEPRPAGSVPAPPGAPAAIPPVLPARP